MTRRPSNSIVGSPVLVGTVTVLVTIVAVYLSYNANSGLPFVPTTELHLQLVSGANLGEGNEVREGGFRVGRVQRIEPVLFDDGVTGAELTLQLDRAAGDIPVDSTFSVRLRSAVGLKYLELSRGSSPHTFTDGATVLLDRTRIATDLDEVLSIFDGPTRIAVRETLTGLGDAAAGRGRDLNAAIAGLSPLLEVVEPVMTNFASPRTQLTRLVRELGDTAGALAPVAGRNARLFTTMADTFAALSADGRALSDSIAKAPATLAEGERVLRNVRPFLQRTAALARDLDAAARTARRTLPTVNGAVEVTTPVVRRSAQLGDPLRRTLVALDELTREPRTNEALRAVTASVTTLQPQIRFLGPHITVCNIPTLWFTFVAEDLSAPDLTGSSQRGLPQFADIQDDGLGFMGANEVATGRNALGTPQHLHAATGTSAVDDHGRADCELGQQGFPFGSNPYDDTPDRFYRSAYIQPQDLGLQGPLYDTFRDGRGVGLGPNRIPEGQTFTRRPGGRAAPEN